MADTLQININAQDNASETFKGISTAGVAMGVAIGNIMSGLVTAGFNLAKQGAEALAGVLTSSITDAMDAQKAIADLEATLASTGATAKGITLEGLQADATALSRLTVYTDEQINSAQGMLLTFTAIGKDVFPMATEAVANLAQKMGGDMKGAAIQVGKALQDPITGVTALRRVGVMLTDQQEAQIKSLVGLGKTSEAQKIILAELETEFGGLAKAMGQTTGGQITILQHRFDEMKETIGTAFLPALTGVTGFINTTFAPALEKLAADIAPKIQAAFVVLGELFPAIQAGWEKNDWSKLAGWLAKIFPADMSEEIATAIGRIADALKSGNWELVKTNFWNWLVKVTEQISEKFSELARQFSTWVQTEGALKFQTVGHDIAGLIMQGIGDLFLSKSEQGKAGKNIIAGLEDLARGIGTSIVSIGWGIGSGVAEGLYSALRSALGMTPMRNETKQLLENFGQWMAGILFDPGAWGQALTDLLNLIFAGAGANFLKYATPSAAGASAMGAGTMSASSPFSNILPRQGAGAQTVVNFVYSPAVSLATKQEAQNILQPFIERGIVNARSRQIGATA